MPAWFKWEGDNGPQPPSQMLYSHVSNKMLYNPRAYNSNALFKSCHREACFVNKIVFSNVSVTVQEVFTIFRYIMRFDSNLEGLLMLCGAVYELWTRHSLLPAPPHRHFLPPAGFA